ncbi:FtsH protease activity modulator HflK [Sulfuriflexus mobilis]|uniref:FtsH protease activity modulator HflK n=1 Tax=Sulfuriflexus mobilis TaxID=1811807 RepID=UPI000F828A36|nr:FtsH protease activity modulator HflK [Sulfuriflexus mobilis]
MAWNEPGNSGGGNGRDPWGNRGDQGPPDLDEVVRKMRDKVGGLFGGGGGSGSRSSSSPGGTFSIIILVLAAWLLYDASYVIEPAERGVVLRFGKHVDTLQPGFNMRLPRPVEKLVRVNVENIRKLSVGGTQAESLMLTRDENIIDIEFSVQYKIKNASDYVFNVRNPEESLLHATETAVREIVGKTNMDYVITEGRDVVAVQARDLVQQILDDYGTGLEVTEFNMQDAQPPEQVQNAFADAVKAREDEVRFKNEAEAYSRDLLGKAVGAAQREVLDAQGYRSKVIESSTGEAARFANLLIEYEKAPEVTRERLYIETMETVLGNSTKIMTDTKAGNNIMYLPLDQLMRQQGQGTSQQNTFSSASSNSTDVPQAPRTVIDPRSRGGR